MGALLGSAGEGFAALGETRYYMDNFSRNDI